jgi:hypothetical protein
MFFIDPDDQSHWIMVIGGFLAVSAVIAFSGADLNNGEEEFPDIFY